MPKASKTEYMRAHRKTPRGKLYICWKHMVRRCCDPTSHGFSRYGGRGISVCEDWKAFTAFYQWATANGWQLHLQIDRKDNSKGYSPGNCHWVTSRQNNRNRDNNKLNIAKVAEIRRLLSQGWSGPRIAKKYGVHHSLIYRIKLGQQWL
jgi:hypothetical protein